MAFLLTLALAAVVAAEGVRMRGAPATNSTGRPIVGILSLPMDLPSPLDKMGTS
jgi:hypothetical protein